MDNKKQEDLERKEIKNPLHGFDMPCNESCKKCGSIDIYRRFEAKGSKIKNEEYDKSPYKWVSGQCYSYKADRDFIFNHCRVCQYDWVSKPLSKNKVKA